MEKWEDFNHLTYTILHGSDKEERLHEKTDIYLINPEGLKWFLEPGTGRFEVVSPDVLCVDESTRFKATNTQRFKLLRPRIPSFSRRWILTGTPIPNGIMDIFGQVYILDQGGSLGRYITHFRNKWFYQTGFGGYTWSPMPGAFEEITERIGPLTLRLAAKDHLSLPNLRIGPQWDIYVDLPRKAMEVYRSLENDFLTRLEGGAIIASNAAAAGTKCRQVANGACYHTEEDEDGLPDLTKKDWYPIHDEKIKALASLREELGGAPLLIFYEFDHDRQRIQKEFDIPCLTGTTPAKGDALIRQFNDGKLRDLLAHPASAGHGLNMQETCKYVCFFGLTWNLENYIQAIQRVWRRGQENDVTVYRILARGTLDESVAYRLNQKELTQENMLDVLAEIHLNEYLKKLATGSNPVV
jgi:hypothetical protein